ncbi:HIT domain-containing protein [Nocardiopsis sp. HNM0947]|uniref:HIT domain-containing protein n=1 Tax=Nocardiopsis coralli TaxID=2772213 RepID=A0ABR9P046_9ACTN|nr:HIT domain-containing protein [Nocardiopsis coralli]MBE2997211.1 HIT domain-containing protein [Nocardiopsis coralli]
MSTTFDDICTFCHELNGQASSNLFFDLGLARSRSDYILHESNHFVVMPCIGALTDWYLLIVSKRHTLSVGWLDEAERADLRSLINEVTELVRRRTGLRSLVFEHGSLDFRNKGGACYDHTHVHVVATDRDHQAFLDQIPPPVAMHECPDWVASAHQLVQEHQRSYLALGTPRQDWIGQATGAPSQFFRRCLTTWIGTEKSAWDWLVFPQAERVQRMITDFARA